VPKSPALCKPGTDCSSLLCTVQVAFFTSALLGGETVSTHVSAEECTSDCLVCPAQVSKWCRLKCTPGCLSSRFVVVPILVGFPACICQRNVNVLHVLALFNVRDALTRATCWVFSFQVQQACPFGGFDKPAHPQPKLPCLPHATASTIFFSMSFNQFLAGYNSNNATLHSFTRGKLTHVSRLAQTSVCQNLMRGQLQPALITSRLCSFKNLHPLSVFFSLHVFLSIHISLSSVFPLKSRCRTVFLCFFSLCPTGCEFSLVFTPTHYATILSAVVSPLCTSVFIQSSVFFLSQPTLFWLLCVLMSIPRGVSISMTGTSLRFGGGNVTDTVGDYSHPDLLVTTTCLCFSDFKTFDGSTSTS
jgi:hypothetical protein